MTYEERKKFFYRLEEYLEFKINFSQKFRMESPNKNWVNIKILPDEENKEAYIVLRILKNTIKIDYYIKDNKDFYQYLYCNRNEIEAEAGNEYKWITSKRVRCAVQNEKEISSEKWIEWFEKEILTIYKVFPKYLHRFKRNYSIHRFNEAIYLEGEKKEKISIIKERNPLARKKCIELKGTTCEICGMNFKEKYGEIGDGFIEVHHIIPISKIELEYEVDPEKDLIPVCSNCHSMLHRRFGGDFLTVNELKERIRNK